MRIAIAITHAPALGPTWTTAHFAQAALEAGHRVHIVESGDFEVTAGRRLVCRSMLMDAPFSNAGTLAQAVSSRALMRRALDLVTCDLLLMRVNPLTLPMLATALAAQELGVRVVNDPTGMARTHTKSWLAALPDVPIPRTIVTRSRASAHLFAGNLDGDAVVKPARGSGGRDVMRVSHGQPQLLDAALDKMQAAHGRGAFIVQAYEPDADQGEKRLFWVDGQILCAYLRLRPDGGFHHNLRQGGRPAQCEMTESDRAISAAIGPHLLRNGIRIAGLDVIGRNLIEVNTLNPGGIHYAESFRTGAGRAVGIAQTAIGLLTSESPRIRPEVQRA